jgi:hypothetical protein
MKNRHIHTAFIGLLGLFLSTSLFAQGRGEARGARGEAPQRGEQGNRGERGERGEPGKRGNEVAAQRKAIQEQQKAAIAQENARFKLAMMSLQDNAKKATDSNAKTLAKMEAAAARRNHDAELKRIRTQAQAALNALKR